VIYLIFGSGPIASVVGGTIWLIALRALYNIEWLKAIVVAAIAKCI
jgi:hypothetical protein